MSENTSRRTTRRRLLVGTGATAVLAGAGGHALATSGPQGGAQEQATAAALRTFSSIDGVPVFYEGSTSSRRWQCDANFYVTLIAWMRDLKRASGNYGRVGWISSLGFYVDRPGQHGLGRAMDLSGIVWTGGQICHPYVRDHASGSVARRRRYLGVDAICRMWFHWTLDGWYNAAHGNHIHADTATVPAKLSKSARSDTVFVQSACNHFLRNTLVAVDGAWGPRTEAAWNRLRWFIGVPGEPTTSSDVYRKILYSIGKHGFANKYVG